MTNPRAFVCYFEYIGAVYFDHLIFPKGIGAVFLAVYGNSDTSVIPAAGEIHATPEEQGKHHDANNKSLFFFLQFQYLSQKSMRNKKRRGQNDRSRLPGTPLYETESS